ncbi:Cation antiporter [Candidatus Terasakiella magnetica]|uniref:Cation antiporter n=1 Tax=Candidatus Terasakiella magnetica TaxID=1867952 RepID=A0A1C3RCH1_9PROT|nr:Na+/H+ antiporter subunit E [Candidatus Terasakiella magnetica]SCA54965.1 Cation antiporter [Candidatus Terasakiella magnetica]
MASSISLWVFLYVFWFLLSGHTEPLLLGFGAISCTLVVYIAHRMDVIDHEGHPSHISFKILPYWIWLCWEIVKANIDVAKVILSPKMPISPVMFKTKASQKRELGQVIYANSITLTPGTVAVGLEDGVLEIHALTKEGAEGVLTGEMDRKVCWCKGEMEGKS